MYELTAKQLAEKLLEHPDYVIRIKTGLVELALDETMIVVDDSDEMYTLGM